MRRGFRRESTTWEKSSPAASTGWRRNCRTQKFSAPTLSTAFLMNLRHPSSPSGAFAQLLNRGGLSEEQTREYLGIIQEESGRLAEMATGVLNYTRIENQKILTGTRAL